MNLLATLSRFENRIDRWLGSDEISGNGSRAKSDPRAYAYQQWTRARSEIFSSKDVKEVESTAYSFTVEMTVRDIGTSNIKIEWDSGSYTITYKSFRQESDTIVKCKKEQLYTSLRNAIIQCWP